MAIATNYLECVFEKLELIAAAGHRCPTRHELWFNAEAIPMLARQGRIKIEISGKNYRTVTILTGRHAGKRTAPDPSGSKVWRVIDKNGSRMISSEERAA